MGRKKISKDEKVVPLTIHIKRSSIKAIGGSNDFKKAERVVKKRLSRVAENMLYETQYR